ncbi:MAG TPA: hypothetical protein VED46_02475 [Alphaproteobacteria bacterium]|nr:hypothetical protein [Alphaproteobacteria bacterium]
MGDFWRGDLPLGRAFWLWGILGGGIVSLASTLLALGILAGGGSGWLALAGFAAHIPWNLVLLVGIWRSSARPGIRPEVAQMARLAIVAWVIVLSVV